MRDLIPIIESERDGETVLTVDARLLHSVLEVGKVFGAWIKERIEKYNFVENTDYWRFFPDSEKTPGGRPLIDYALTIDMAKELAMVENNPMGRKVRKYFIECERKYKANLFATRTRGELADKRALMLAESLKNLAASGLYTPVKAALFEAEAVSALSGKPLVEYLPPVVGERDKWLTPTQLGDQLRITPHKIGSILKRAGLHGTSDVGHKHSEPFWNIVPHSERQVISYKYDPEVVFPVLRRHSRRFSGTSLFSLVPGPGE